MSNTIKGGVVTLTIFIFFCLMSKMDFIVHKTLYHHGLQFSYEWALDYWVVYTALFVAFSALISLFYWLGSNKTTTDLKFSIGILATVNLLMLGGLQDIMFYLLWEGSLPPNNVVWWWMPWIHLFGKWSSLTQILATALALFAASSLWIVLLAKSAKQ